MMRVPKIVAITQQKGGAGKTTLAVNLAGELASRGQRVELLDADPQGCATAWAREGRLGFGVRTASISDLGLTAWVHAVWAMAGDVIVIDTPPNAEAAVGAAAAVADVVLVPCGASGLELRAAGATLEVLSIARRYRTRPGPEVVLVPVRVDRRSAEGKSIEDDLHKLGTAVAPSVGLRTAYVRSYANGETVATLAPGSDADLEIRALADVVLESLRPSEAETRRGVEPARVCREELAPRRVRAAAVP
jgi:chromosome partitioning protein